MTIKDEFEFPDEKEAKQGAKASEQDNFELVIEDDTPPEDQGKKPAMKKPVEEVTDEELDNYSKQAERRIKKFSKGYHDERRAKEQALREREAAENFARQVFEENKKLKEQLSSGSKVLIETSKNAAEAELAAAKEKYKKAYESADPDGIVEAQEEIARATLKMERAGTMRPIEHNDDKEFNIPQHRQAEPDTPQPSRRTQAWLENNGDWFGQDEEMTMAAMGLDKKLQKQYGADYVGTKEYFDTIDNTMRKRFPEYFEDDDAQSTEEQSTRKRTEPVDEDDSPRRATKPATVVAPASRSTPPSRIRLKASEAAIARRLGVPLELYAKQVAQLKRGE